MFVITNMFAPPTDTAYQIKPPVCPVLVCRYTINYLHPCRHCLDCCFSKNGLAAAAAPLASSVRFIRQMKFAYPVHILRACLHHSAK